MIYLLICNVEMYNILFTFSILPLLQAIQHIEFVMENGNIIYLYMTKDCQYQLNFSSLLCNLSQSSLIIFYIPSAFHLITYKFQDSCS